jgi:Tol biopolymer transport system component
MLLAFPRAYPMLLLWIAFAEWVDGHYRISEWQRESRLVRTIVSGSGDYRYPAYSPSNRWLLFSENVSGNWDVVRLSLGDGRREVLTASDANDFMPAISPDERTLYFASDRRRGYRYTGIFRLELR